MTALFRRHRRGRPPHPDVLTPAEWRVLEEVRAGRSNPEIAERLGVSRNTVKTHISSMLTKLDLPDREALAAWDGEPAVEVTAPRGRLALLAPLGWLSGRGAAVAGAGVTVIVLIAFVAAMESGRIIADDPAPPAGIPTPDATEPMAPSTGGDASHLLQPVDPSRWVRHDIDANGTMPLDHGMLFVDAATGDGELWALEDGDRQMPYRATPDGRFVLHPSSIFDRERSVAYAWSGQLIGDPTDSGYALYRGARQSCSYTLIDLNVSPPQIAFEFETPSPIQRCGDQAHAVIADDGSAVFVTASSQDTNGQALVFLAEQTSGTATDLGPFGTSSATFEVLGSGLVALTPIWTRAPVVNARIYTWDGALVGSVSGASTTGGRVLPITVSPDGRTIAWQEEPALSPPDGLGGVYFWPAVVVADAESGEPRFRVTLAALHTGRQVLEWLPDGSALMIGTAEGFALLSPDDGTVTPLPFGPAGHADPIPLPAPDDAGRLLYDGAIVDDSGNVLTAPAPAWAEWVDWWWFYGSYEWGETSDEVRIMRFQPLGGDTGPGDVGDLSLPPRIEMPPFDNELRVRATGTEEDRTLRERPEGDAETTGTVEVDATLTVVDSEQSDGCNGASSCATTYDPDWTEDEPLFWIHVRDESGLEGWLPARDLAWAE